MRPQSFYAIHKMVTEEYCRLYHEAFGLWTAFLRLSNPYGPRQQIKHGKYGIVNWFVRLALEGRPLTVFGDGAQARDYFYIDDAVEAFLAAALHDRGGEVFNIGGGKPISFRTMAETIAAATGARVIRDTFPARLERGGARPRPEPLPYLTELAVDAFAGLAHLILVGTQPPAGFFAYPGRPSLLADPATALHGLATPEEDAVAALEALADALGAPADAPAPPAAARPEPPNGALDPMTLAAAVGALLPEGAIVVDEAVTAAFGLFDATAGAPEHDWLFLTGGAIGQGLPLATGAAVAAPDRPVLCLEGDGSAMYTVQALWTQAREGLDVTSLIVANRSYAILQFELARVGAEPGDAMRDLLEIGRPELDFAALARSMGVPGRRVHDGAELAAALRESFAEPGPHLIEAVL
jgi:acetolactate synthase-1/2/3 large subunit